MDRESITSLIKLAEQAINDDFSDIDYQFNMSSYRFGAKGGVLANLQGMGYQPGNVTQRKLIIPILRIFISLCSTPQFHWHLSKYNALDLLNRIREKDDDCISDVAKEVCEKVIDHSHEGQINLFQSQQQKSSYAGASGLPGTTGTAAIGANNDASLAAEYNIQFEIDSICKETNLQNVKNAVINMEKMLIQKKLKLDKFGNPELQSLLDFFQQTLVQHQNAGSSGAPDEETNSQLRRIIIKSMLVILNFVYSKKYLKEIIAGYSQPAAADTKATKQDIFGGSKQIKPSSRCVLEE